MKGVRARLVLWNVLAIGLILGAMGVALRFQLRSNLLAQIDLELQQVVSRVSTAPSDESLIDGLPGKLSVDGSAKELIRQHFLSKNAARFYEVVKNNQGQASIKTDIPLPRLIPVGHDLESNTTVLKPLDSYGYAQAAAGKKVFHNTMEGGHLVRSISEPVYSGGQIIAVAQTTKELAPVAAQLHELDLSLATLLPWALIVAAGAGWLLVGSTMRPLRRLTESARCLDADLSTQRLPVVGSDEFAELARTFNEAFDTTAGAFATQRRAMLQLERFTGDAGHELRTPLGAIKGSVSFLLHGRKWNKEVKTSLEIIDASSDRMNRLIQDLLLLARHDGGKHAVDCVPVCIADAVKEALLLLSMPSHLATEVCVEDELRALADASGLVRVFTNLLSNGFTYARSKVRLSALVAGGGILVIVEDDGEGISPEHLPRLGERFYRPETARGRQVGGTGLGLAIAKSLAESYGGTLEIQSAVGIGTKAIVHLLAL